MKSTQKKGDDTLKVFLSYTTADSAYGDKLRNLLSHYLNAQVFTTDLLSAGENWRSRLKAELNRSNIFMVFLSANSINSPWVWQELGAAWALQKPIISVFSEPQLCAKLPMELSDVQYVNVKELEDPESFNRIFEQYFIQNPETTKDEKAEIKQSADPDESSKKT